jgi:hypothetical protein
MMLLFSAEKADLPLSFWLLIVPVDIPFRDCLHKHFLKDGFLRAGNSNMRLSGLNVSYRDLNAGAYPGFSSLFRNLSRTHFLKF